MTPFFCIHISQGSVATCLKRGGIFKHEFVANLLPSRRVKKLKNRIIVSEVMTKSLVSCFFDSRCRLQIFASRFFLEKPGPTCSNSKVGLNKSEHCYFNTTKNTDHHMCSCAPRIVIDCDSVKVKVPRIVIDCDSVKVKVAPYLITERRVPELILVLESACRWRES